MGLVVILSLEQPLYLVVMCHDLAQFYPLPQFKLALAKN